VCAEVEGISRERIQVIYNGVDLGEDSAEPELRRSLGMDAGHLLVGNMANLKRVKGQDILLRAFRLVVNDLPHARLVICGGDEGEGLALKHLSQELGLSEHVSFLGICHNLKAIYGSLDLYVHSSRAEGLSNGVLEAMAYGVPVVATTAGGTPELFGEDERECLVAPEDPSALAEAMLRTLKDETLRRKFGSAGRSRIGARFTVSGMVAAHEAVYLQLVHSTVAFKGTGPAGGLRRRVCSHPMSS
jgi:glycosyltransferase involved in cell wall biosynthesis